MKGKVYLVGAGPGDPGLITRKGLECIKKADVLIYDYLASPILLQYAPKRAEVIYVGKKGSDHTLPQDKINSLIKEKAKKGFIVTRLKGGDPFIFGRGGEEAEVLIKAQIPFEVVPGVTSAIAAPAYAGIPLTHREFTSTVAFVTGHEDPTKKRSSIEWEALAKGIGTIVFLMGVKNLPHITNSLIGHGMNPDTPTALIRWGTTHKQTVVDGTLDNIVDRVREVGLKPPAIIVVGQVVSLRKTMKWFENKPLAGKKIVITRARGQASKLATLFSELGAECLECPTIKIVPTDNWKPLDNAIENILLYDWLIFTSVNGVSFFFERLFAKGKDTRALGNLKIAVIGPATEKRLFDFGIKSDIVPESYRAESIIEAFTKEDIKSKKILLPRAKDARAVLPLELTNLGAVVDEIEIYCAEKEFFNVDALLQQLEKKSIDLVTFTSSSTVKNFRSLIPDEKFDSLMQDVTIASIGPITTDTAKQLGFNVHITAKSFTIEGLCEAVQRNYKLLNK